MLYIGREPRGGKRPAPLATTNPLGLAAHPLYSAGWYAEFSWQGRRLKLTDGEERYDFTPAWLTLPLQRRELAEKRREEILVYERLAEPGESDARAAASRLGITLGHFYTLLRRWRARRSIFVLTPYADIDANSGSRLEPAVYAKIQEIVDRAINREGIRSAAAILKRVSEEWDIPQRIPSHMTLRKYITAALASFEGVSGRFVTVSSSLLPPDVIERARAYGDVVVIDHTAPSIFVAGEDGPYTPLITLVIDVCTSSIVGKSISVPPPGPDGVIRAMRDAMGRSMQIMQLGDDVAEPELVLQAAPGPEWNELIELIHRSNFAARVRKGAKFHYGTLVSQLIGTKLGELGLSRHKAHGRERPFDPARDALVTVRELDLLVELGIKALNAKRLPAGTPLRGMQFPLPEHFAGL